jgi:hypothetical protein
LDVFHHRNDLKRAKEERLDARKSKLRMSKYGIMHLLLLDDVGYSRWST